MMKLRFAVGATAVMLLAAAAGAVLLDPTIPAEKALQKHRADVNKQVAKYITCATKAVIACEQKGVSSAPECDIQDPSASTIADTTAKTKFVDAIAKCTSRLDFTKKGPASDYSLVGCPGDADPGTPGEQPYADYTAMQADLPPAIARAIVPLTASLQNYCGGTPPTSDATVLGCQTKGARYLSKYVKAVANCQWRCENDYRNKKGNGGPTDDLNQCAARPDLTGPYPSPDFNFDNCLALAQERAEGMTTYLLPVGDLTLAEFQGLEGAVGLSLNTLNNDGYNEACPAVCGNNILEAGEQCDGTDAALCPGHCQSDCTCLACGDSSFPTCGGSCPSGEVCQALTEGQCVGGPPTCCVSPSDVNSCLCVPTADTCAGQSCTGSCCLGSVPFTYGPCSAGETCRTEIDTTTGEVVRACDLPPCQATTGGFCWFLGAVGESCNTVCANNGRTYDTATSYDAGSLGTDTECDAVLDDLGAPNSALLSTPVFGLGCFFNVTINVRTRDTMVTSAWALASFAERACACQ